MWLWFVTFFLQQDLSRHGTYVNSVMIGKGEKRILRHNDIISVVHRDYKLFQFRNLCNDNSKWPHELTDKYFIFREIGSGVSSTVLHVFNCITCEAFALKEIKWPRSYPSIGPCTKKDQVNDECNIMRSIEHSCVMKFFDVCNTQNAIYILLEYMEGGDLLSRISHSANSCLSENISKLFFYQMCHAVKHLHNQNIVHRELKLANILMATSEDDTLIKIGNFGLNKIRQDKAEMRAMYGTPCHLAPESLPTLGFGSVSNPLAVDIWSLGLVLYMCLSGKWPFHERYGTPVANQIMEGDLQFRSRNWLHVSETAQNLLKQLFTVDANQRPTIDQVLQHEWFDDDDIKCKAHRIMGIGSPQ